MNTEFTPEKLKIKDKVYKKKQKTIISKPADYGVIYHIALKALYQVFLTDFVDESLVEVDDSMMQKSADFLESVNTEMELEKES